MFRDKEDVDFILGLSHGEPIELAKVDFILEDFPEGGKIIINDGHLFEILKVENGTVLMKPIGTCLIARDTTNLDQGTTTRRYIENGEIAEKSI